MRGAASVSLSLTAAAGSLEEPQIEEPQMDEGRGEGPPA